MVLESSRDPVHLECPLLQSLLVLFAEHQFEMFAFTLIIRLGEDPRRQLEDICLCDAGGGVSQKLCGC